jgi:hypothetical protein
MRRENKKKAEDREGIERLFTRIKGDNTVKEI